MKIEWADNNNSNSEIDYKHFGDATYKAEIIDYELDLDRKAPDFNTKEIVNKPRLMFKLHPIALKEGREWTQNFFDVNEKDMKNTYEVDGKKYKSYIRAYFNLTENGELHTFKMTKSNIVKSGFLGAIFDEKTGKLYDDFEDFIGDTLIVTTKHKVTEGGQYDGRVFVNAVSFSKDPDHQPGVKEKKQEEVPFDEIPGLE